MIKYCCFYCKKTEICLREHKPVCQIALGGLTLVAHCQVNKECVDNKELHKNCFLEVKYV